MAVLRDQTVLKNRFRFVIIVCIAAIFSVSFLSTQSRTSILPDDTSLPPVPKVMPLSNSRKVTHNGPKITLFRYSGFSLNGTILRQGQEVRSLSHWEEMTQNDPKMSDNGTLASSQRSELIIVKRKDPYFVGDVVEVLVRVKDEYGRRKIRGGDEVRVWSRGQNLTGSLGVVTDLGDGTYRGRVKVFWAGTITIKAGIFTPREGIAFLYKIVNTGTTQYGLNGYFRDGRVSETVTCTASKEIALGFSGYCDLTKKNHDLPWFCAKPKNVPCSSWFMHGRPQLNFQASDVESHMMKSMTLRSSMNMSIKITSQKRLKPSTPPSEIRNNLTSSIPCNTIPVNITWHVSSPVGYAYRGKWFSSFCSSNYSLSLKRTSQCLSGRRFWLLGDSTTRQLYVYLMKKLKLKQITDEWTNPKSYNFSLAEDSQRTFSIAYSVHGLPFGYGGKHVIISNLVATHAYIDSIPAASRDIVLVHFYSHFQTVHPDVMRHTLRKTVEAIKRLHQRAPEVMFLVKGPHAFQPREVSIHVNDFWGNVVGDIFREEFLSVQHYVVYLDMWDVTASMENINIHPYNHVIKMIVNYILSFTCPRPS